MARRSSHESDAEQTGRLGIEELFVQKGRGGSNYLTVWNAEPEPEACPLCGSDQLKVQNRFSRVYLDLIPEGGMLHPVRLDNEFFKYRCLQCRHIFPIDIRFAEVNDNVTHRLADYIAGQVIARASYQDIETALQGALTRQAIGQIFNRWVHNKEEKRKIRTTPETIAVFTGSTDRDRFTLLLSCEGGIRILDAMYGVEADRIAASLRQLDLTQVRTVLTNCDEVAYSVVSDLCREALYIIPVEAWFQLVTDDFAQYAHDCMRWVTRKKKQELILQPPVSGYRHPEVEAILHDRPQLRQAYEDYHSLRRKMADQEERIVFEEIRQWLEGIQPEFRAALSATILQLDLYEDRLRMDEQHPDRIPPGLCAKVRTLETLIQKRKTFSDESLKAAVLYCRPVPGDWRGIPIEDVINDMEEIGRKASNE